MLTQINLINFKCFEDEQIPLRPLTLLTGLNGMGKSTVLQAILLIKQNSEFSISNNYPWELNGDYIKLGNVRDILFQYFNKREITISLSGTSNNQYGPSIWTLDASKSDSDVLPILKKPEDAELMPAFLFHKDFHYLNAERIGPRTTYPMANFKVVNESQIGIQGELVGHYLSIKGGEPIAIPELRFPETDPEDPQHGLTLLEQVNAWLSVIRPNTRVSASTNRDVSLVALKYQFIGGSDRGNEFRPPNVGFGLSYVLPLIVAILISPPNSLLLIENPEAHLHPRGQAEIGRLMSMAASNGVQIIVETHSDHIMNGIRVAVKNEILNPNKCAFLFFTGAVNEGKFQHYHEEIELTKAGKLSHRPDGFFDESDNLLIQLV